MQLLPAGGGGLNDPEGSVYWFNLQMLGCDNCNLTIMLKSTDIHKTLLSIARTAQNLTVALDFMYGRRKPDEGGSWWSRGRDSRL